jgi:mycothiol synthase
MHIRSVRRPDDLAALEELFELSAECDGHQPIGEHKYLDLIHAHPDRETGIVVEDKGQVVAYAAVAEWPEDASGTIEMAFHPLFRSSDLVTALLDKAVERVGELGATTVRMWAFQPKIVEVLEAAGFVPERELRLLRIGLPVLAESEFPGGIEVRGFRPGSDDAEWIAVNNSAFSGHPENGNWTRAILDDRKRQAWFDPDGFRMAWSPEGLAGFCWTKMHDEETGEIYVIAVNPSWQGRGLGTALVLDGLRYLHEKRGASAGTLYVDAGNAGAITLYERLGFRLDHIDRALVRRL